MEVNVEGTMTRVRKVLVPNARYYGGKADEVLWIGVESNCHLGKMFINTNSLLESGA